MTTEIKTITVIGAGTMGHGIAQTSALAGFETRLYDLQSEAIQKGRASVEANLEKALARGKYEASDVQRVRELLTYQPDFAKAIDSTDLVIEAIVENLSAKKELVATIESQAKQSTIIASNTSSLSLAKIAENAKRPDQIVGMHFFNPVPIMTLLEIVVHDKTNSTTLDRVKSVGLAMKKEPIVVRDSPGFASSRLGVVLGLEAMRMLEQGVASAEDIDKAMELGYRHPMGPLKLTDLVGLDVRLAIAETLHRELGGPQYEPPQILRDKVKAGELGKKTGQGFYSWGD